MAMPKPGHWGIICLLAVCTARGGVVFTNLHTFTGLDGYNASTTKLVQGPDAIYGTSAWGFDEMFSPSLDGTVYKTTRDGSLTHLAYFFGGSSGLTNGEYLL